MLTQAPMELRYKSNIPDPVPELVFLQEFFGEVLDVPLGEGDVGSNDKLVLA